MNASYIRTLFEYDRWANARTIAAAEDLSNEQLTRDMGNSFRSVRDTLVHILSAQRTWLSRWQGSSPTKMLDPADFPDMEVLRGAWSALRTELGEFLNSLTDEQLQAVLAYKSLAGQSQEQPLWQQMAHLANHGSYHRGQITTMLRQLGAAPANTDLILFFRERGN